MSPEDAEASVASRLTRWKLLAESGLGVALDPDRGSAALGVVHSYALMAEQLDRIIEATKLPNVRLRIIALDTVSPQVAPLHSFHIYGGEPVTFGTESGTALLSDPQRVASFAATFAELERLALYDDDARSLLDRVSQEYRICTV